VFLKGVKVSSLFLLCTWHCNSGIVVYITVKIITLPINVSLNVRRDLHYVLSY